MKDFMEELGKLAYLDRYEIRDLDCEISPYLFSKILKTLVWLTIQGRVEWIYDSIPGLNCWTVCLPDSRGFKIIEQGNSSSSPELSSRLGLVMFEINNNILVITGRLLFSDCLPSFSSEGYTLVNWLRDGTARAVRLLYLFSTLQPELLSRVNGEDEK